MKELVYANSDEEFSGKWKRQEIKPYLIVLFCILTQNFNVIGSKVHIFSRVPDRSKKKEPRVTAPFCVVRLSILGTLSNDDGDAKDDVQ